MCRITFARNGRVTVVLPTFNRADALARAIRSALDQTAAALCDVVVVDDGSTDQTPRVVRRFAGALVYIRQSNAGVSAARNTAIRARPNEFVAFLDSDDEWHPNTVALQLDALRRFPGVVLVTGRTQFRRPDGSLGDPDLPEIPLDQPFDLAPFLFERCIVQTPAIMVRSEYLARTGLFYPDMRNCGDHELLVRLACQGPCLYLSQHLMVYSREDARRLTDSVPRAFSADLRARNRMRPALRARPDCRPHWRRGTARTLQVLRDHAFRSGRYAQAARFGFHSLMAWPWRRPRWEWGRLGSALLHSVFA
jgi:glycosyltransferase involved in cell wall biosynthesis